MGCGSSHEKVAPNTAVVPDPLTATASRGSVHTPQPDAKPHGAAPAPAGKLPASAAPLAAQPPADGADYVCTAAPRFDGDVDAGFARAYEGSSGVMEVQYPMHCMKMADFLALESLEPHNGLVERGLVVPLDLSGAHKDAAIQFVSHQWLGYTVADPNGDHLRTMQAAFRQAIDGPEQLFKSADDWESFALGLTSANLTTLQSARAAAKKISQESGEPTDEVVVPDWVDPSTKVDVNARREKFSASVRDGWVWMECVAGSAQPVTGSLD